MWQIKKKKSHQNKPSAELDFCNAGKLHANLCLFLYYFQRNGMKKSVSILPHIVLDPPSQGCAWCYPHSHSSFTIFMDEIMDNVSLQLPRRKGINIIAAAESSSRSTGCQSPADDQNLLFCSICCGVGYGIFLLAIKTHLDTPCIVFLDLLFLPQMLVPTYLIHF